MVRSIPTKILLIRHGEVDNPQQTIYGRSQISLNDIGRKQIEMLAHTLKQKAIDPDIIFSSPLKRTVETTEVLKHVFVHAQEEYDNRLLEVDCEAIVGKSLAWVNELKGDVYTYCEKEGITIEDPSSIAIRMNTVVDMILNQYQRNTIFLVSHGDPLAFLLWSLLHNSFSLPTYTHMGIPSLYLKKGQAWILEFDEKKLISHSRIEPK